MFSFSSSSPLTSLTDWIPPISRVLTKPALAVGRELHQHLRPWDPRPHLRSRRGSCTASCRKNSSSVRVSSSIRTKLRVLSLVPSSCCCFVVHKKRERERGQAHLFACLLSFCAVITLRMKKWHVIRLSVLIEGDDRFSLLAQVLVRATRFPLHACTYACSSLCLPQLPDLPSNQSCVSSFRVLSLTQSCSNDDGESLSLLLTPSHFS